jgi:hypothetical protein
MFYNMVGAMAGGGLITSTKALFDHKNVVYTLCYTKMYICYRHCVFIVHIHIALQCFTCKHSYLLGHFYGTSLAEHNMRMDFFLLNRRFPVKIISQSITLHTLFIHG